MLLDIKKVSEMVCRSHSFNPFACAIDPYTCNAYKSFEVCDLPEDIQRRLIEIPKYHLEYRPQIIYCFFKKYEDLCPLYVTYLKKTKKLLTHMVDVLPSKNGVILKLIEEHKDKYPEFTKQLEFKDIDSFRRDFMGFIDYYDFWDPWGEVEEKYVIKCVKKWCIENNLPYEKKTQKKQETGNGCVSSDKTTE